MNLRWACLTASHAIYYGLHSFTVILMTTLSTNVPLLMVTTIADITRKSGVLLLAYQLPIGADPPHPPGGCRSNQHKSSQNIEVKRFE
jgi:hypothetical protein